MPNRRPRRRRGGRVTPKGTRPHNAKAPTNDDYDDLSDFDDLDFGEEPDLLAEVREGLAEAHPFAVLAYASSLYAALDPRQRDPFDRSEPAGPSREELIESFLDVEEPETSALLYVFAEFTDDELKAARIRRAVAARAHDLPAWVSELGKVEVVRALEQTDVIQDGDNVILGVRLPRGHEMTVVVYIDHNLGRLVKDAFVVPAPLDEVLSMMEEHGEPNLRRDDLDRADARTRITEAIEHAAITYPRFETESWPACRPLVEWVTRKLPEGGRGYEIREWDDDELDAIVARLLDSPFGAPLRDDDHAADLLQVILYFASRYGPCDPFHWSPVVVELMLVDRIPRKVLRHSSVLAKAPEVMRAVIRFAHAARGIPPERTDETLEAVDRWQPEYDQIIRSSRPQGPMALLAAMGAVDPDGPWDNLDDFLEPAEIHTLEERFGGPDALDALDAEPLPDEQFEWTGIPDDVHGPVGEVLALCDQVCDEVFGHEARTACRRLLARIGREGAAVFRRRGRTETAAAAICWAVGRENGLIALYGYGEGPNTKDLLARFGVKGSVSSRADAMLRAAGVGVPYDGTATLGAEFLTGDRRGKIAARRDELRDR